MGFTCISCAALSSRGMRPRLCYSISTDSVNKFALQQMQIKLY